MNTNAVLNEIALNKREIHHPTWGDFVIKRPTNKIQAMIDTIRTKSTNRDLQTKEIVIDPETGKNKTVPAFLTKSAKTKLLVEFGDWSEEEDRLISEAELSYRDVCKELDDAGYIGVTDIMIGFKEVYTQVVKSAEKSNKKVDEQLEVLFPMLEDLKEDEINVVQLPEPKPEKEFAAARNKLEKSLKDIGIVNSLDRLSNLYKQYNLVLRGLEAQSKMFVLKLRELNIFSDTVEARAEGMARVAKIFYCTVQKNGEKPWKSIEDCEDHVPEVLNWLLSEIEKFERLDPTEDIEDKPRDRFNFLFPRGATQKFLGALQERQEPNSDGESAPEMQESSTAV